MARLQKSVSGEYVEKAERILKGLVRRHLGGATVFLFGSRADGTYRRRSDFDVAYLPREGFDPMGVVRLREDIEESNVIYGVDLVDLSEADESFRKRVLSEGVLWKN